MFDAASDGLTLVLLWPSPLYLMIGIIIGLFFGAVPGLGGLIALALLLPFTFSMEPVAAFALLMGMYAVVTTSDTISSVMLGVPGTAASQATILDGYPMALRGEGARALGAAFTVSAIGGVIGAIVLALSIPLVRPLVLSFASPEFFLLAILGLTMVGSLSGTSLTKGLAAAALGVMLSTIGYAPNGSAPRFAFEATYLFGGLPLVPFVLGLFALPELLVLAVRGGSIAQVEKSADSGGIVDGIRDAAREWWLGVRCSFIGVYVGMLPGIGGSVVDWIAYGHAVQSTRDNPQFGKGDVRGVIAPEAANNAMKGGSLIPTIAFAIPGNASMAIMLGAFTIHGIDPGMSLLSTRLDFTFSLVWMLAIANVIGAGLLMIWAQQVAKVAFLPSSLLIPAIISVVFMGAWLSGNNMGDWMVLLTFGVVGYLMRQSAWPRPPLVLGYLLGTIMEDELHISTESLGMSWVTRPIVLILAALVLLIIIYSLRASRRRKRQAAAAEEVEKKDGNAYVSLLVTLLVAAFFAFAIQQSLNWRDLVGKFPLAIAIPGLMFAMIVIFQDGFTLRRWRADGNLVLADPTMSSEGLFKGARFIVLLISMPIVTVLAGQLTAVGLFAATYLFVWGGYGWKTVAVYTAILLGFIYLMFEWIVPIVWYRPLPVTMGLI
jgi:putative tricarboxylic transport membrane protein